jgi:hypothetical protein
MQLTPFGAILHRQIVAQDRWSRQKIPDWLEEKLTTAK